METTPKITIEELAVKLNGKMWAKGDLKRIYLDRGYNTKKMSTKTYVEETATGNFNVKCFVECPSQDYNWCKSQAEIVIEGVEEDIEEIVKYEKIINQAMEGSRQTRDVVCPIIDKMIDNFENDTYNILSKLNGFALYICYNYNGHHPITVVMNDRTNDIGYLHDSGGFLTFTGDDWMGDDTHTILGVIPKNYFQEND